MLRSPAAPPRRRRPGRRRSARRRAAGRACRPDRAAAARPAPPSRSTGSNAAEPALGQPGPGRPVASAISAGRRADPGAMTGIVDRARARRRRWRRPATRQPTGPAWWPRAAVPAEDMRATVRHDHGQRRRLCRRPACGTRAPVRPATGVAWLPPCLPPGPPCPYRRPPARRHGRTGTVAPDPYGRDVLAGGPRKRAIPEMRRHRRTWWPRTRCPVSAVRRSSAPRPRSPSRTGTAGAGSSRWRPAPFLVDGAAGHPGPAHAPAPAGSGSCRPPAPGW